MALDLISHLGKKVKTDSNIDIFFLRSKALWIELPRYLYILEPGSTTPSLST